MVWYKYIFGATRIPCSVVHNYEQLLFCVLLAYMFFLSFIYTKYVVTIPAKNCQILYIKSSGYWKQLVAELQL